MTTTEPRMLDHALAYAAIGWHVVPLHTPKGKGCDCNRRDCDNIGKHPRTMHGLKDATTDEAKVREYWGMWPHANIGIVCGPSGIVGIDIDPRHGGDESYYDLIKKHGKKLLTDTVSASTGGGGEHYIFAAPRGEHISNVSNSPKFVGPLGVGVDVRAGGGYIVVAPSLHASGGTYSWQEGYSPFDREPALLPHPLFELLSSPASSGEHSSVSMKDILAGVPEGQRDWELFRAAAKLRYADVPVDMALRLITEAAAACIPPFPQSEAIKKVKSAYDRYEAGKAATLDASTHEVPEPIQRVLLDEIIAKGAEPPEYLVDDVLIKGLITLLFGEPESGKTIIAMAWLRLCVERGLHVVFVDEESGVASIADKLRSMGVASVDQYLHYFPFPAIDLASVDAFVELVDSIQPALIIFDSLTDMLSNAGLDENNGIEVTNWMKAIPEALSRKPYAPAVVLIDHIAKDATNTKYSVASRAKKAKSDVLWLVQKEDDFDRDRTAAVDLYRHKNRPGVLPPKVRYIVGGKDGVLVAEPFDATQHGLSAMPDGPRKLLQYVIENDGEALTGNAYKALGVTRETVGQWAKYLLARDYVERFGDGKAAGFRALEKGWSIVRSDDSKPDLTIGESSGRIVRSHPPIGGDLTIRDRAESSDESSDFDDDWEEPKRAWD